MRDKIPIMQILFCKNTLLFGASIYLGCFPFGWDESADHKMEVSDKPTSDVTFYWTHLHLKIA